MHTPPKRVRRLLTGGITAAAVAVTALAVVDMLKGLDKSVRIADVQIEEKTGGKSGDWRRG